jgi:hypothetical protein
MSLPFEQEKKGDKKQEFFYHEALACPEPVEWEGTRRYTKVLSFIIFDGFSTKNDGSWKQK